MYKGDEIGINSLLHKVDEAPAGAETAKRETIFKDIYFACDIHKSNAILSSELLNFLQIYLKQNLDAFNQLKAILDPGNIDPAISCEVFVELMYKWTDFLEKQKETHISPMSQLNLHNKFPRTDSSSSTDFLTETEPESTEMNERIANLELQIQSLINVNALRQQQLENADEQNELLQGDVERLKKRLQIEKEVNEKMTISLERYRIEHDELQNEFKNMKYELESKLNCVEKERDEFKDSLDRLQQENITIQNKLEMLLRKENETNVNLEIVKSELDLKEIEMENIAKLIEDLNKKNEEHVEILNAIRNEKLDLQKKNEDLENVLLQENKTSKPETVVNIFEKAEEVEEEPPSLESEINLVNPPNHEELRQLSFIISEKEHEINALKHHIEDIKSIFSKSECESKLEKETLINEMKHLKNDLEKMKSLDNEYSVLKISRDKLQLELEEVKNQLKIKNDLQSKCELVINQVNTQLDAKKLTINEMQLLNNQLKSKIMNLNQFIQDKEMEIAKLKLNMEEEVTKKNFSNETVNNLRKEIDNQKELFKIMENQHLIEENKLKENIKKLENRYFKVQNELDKERLDKMELKSKVDVLNNELKKIETDFEIKTNCSKKLEEEIRNAQIKQIQLMQNYKEIEDKLKQTTKDLEQSKESEKRLFDKELNLKQSHYSTITHLESQLADLKNINESICYELKSKNDLLTNLSNENSLISIGLNEIFNLFSINIDDNERNFKLKSAIVNLLDEKNDKSKEIRHLKEQIQAINSEYEEKIIHLEKQVFLAKEEGRKEVELKNVEIVRKNSQLRKLENEVQEKDDKIAKLNDECNDLIVENDKLTTKSNDHYLNYRKIAIENDEIRKKLREMQLNSTSMAIWENDAKIFGNLEKSREELNFVNEELTRNKENLNLIRKTISTYGILSQTKDKLSNIIFEFKDFIENESQEVRKIFKAFLDKFYEIRSMKSIPNTIEEKVIILNDEINAAMILLNIFKHTYKINDVNWKRFPAGDMSAPKQIVSKNRVQDKEHFFQKLLLLENNLRATFNIQNIRKLYNYLYLNSSNNSFNNKNIKTKLSQSLQLFSYNVNHCDDENQLKKLTILIDEINRLQALNKLQYNDNDSKFENLDISIFIDDFIKHFSKYFLTGGVTIVFIFLICLSMLQFQCYKYGDQSVICPLDYVIKNIVKSSSVGSLPQ